MTATQKAQLQQAVSRTRLARASQGCPLAEQGAGESFGVRVSSVLTPQRKGGNKPFKEKTALALRMWEPP